MNKGNNELHLALIAGATSALNHLENNRNASHEDALRHVINNSKEIIEKIDLSI